MKFQPSLPVPMAATVLATLVSVSGCTQNVDDASGPEEAANAVSAQCPALPEFGTSFHLQQRIRGAAWATRFDVQQRERGGATIAIVAEPTIALNWVDGKRVFKLWSGNAMDESKLALTATESSFTAFKQIEVKDCRGQRLFVLHENVLAKLGPWNQWEIWDGADQSALFTSEKWDFPGVYQGLTVRDSSGVAAQIRRTNPLAAPYDVQFDVTIPSASATNALKATLAFIPAFKADHDAQH